MSTYDEYLVHRYQGGCEDPECRWCNPEPIPPGVCPALDLLRATLPIDVPDDPIAVIEAIELKDN